MVGSRSENVAEPASTHEQPDTREQQRLDELLAKNAAARAAQPLDAVQDAVHEPGLSLAETLERMMDGYADRPALGERVEELTTDPATGRTSRKLVPAFETVTYGQLWERIRAVAAEWHNDAQRPLSAGDFVALLGFTSTDYATLDLTTAYLGTVAVPLQSSASLGQLKPIVAETGPRLIGTSVEKLDNAVELAISAGTDPRVVVIDHLPEVDDEREKVEAARQRLAEADTGSVDTLGAVDRKSVV